MLSIWLHWERTSGSLYLVSPGLCPSAFFLADFNLYTFTLINHNPEYNSFSEFFESFSQIIEPECDFEGPQIHLSNKGDSALRVEEKEGPFLGHPISALWVVSVLYLLFLYFWTANLLLFQSPVTVNKFFLYKLLRGFSLDWTQIVTVVMSLSSHWGTITCAIYGLGLLRKHVYFLHALL